MQEYTGPLLLDTHVWIWYLSDSVNSLGPAAMSLLESAGTHGNLRVSDISYWEVAVKAAKGKLLPVVDISAWLEVAEQAPGIRFIPLERRLLLLSTRLAGSMHGDPADRMLVATAQLYGIPLVTADQRIVEYARENWGTPVVDIGG